MLMNVMNVNHNEIMNVNHNTSLIRCFINAKRFIYVNCNVVNILDNNFRKLNKKQHVTKNFSLMHSMLGLLAIGFTVG